MHERYENACAHLGETATARDDFDERSWFEQVRGRQPDVFAHMDMERRKLWVAANDVESALVFLSTS